MRGQSVHRVQGHWKHAQAGADAQREAPRLTAAWPCWHCFAGVCQLLNTSKGPAVHGPRMQLDRSLYRSAMQQAILADTPNLHVLEGSVEDLLVAGESADATQASVPRVVGLRLSDERELRCGAEA